MCGLLANKPTLPWLELRFLLAFHVLMSHLTNQVPAERIRPSTVSPTQHPTQLPPHKYIRMLNLNSNIIMKCEVSQSLEGKNQHLLPFKPSK